MKNRLEDYPPLYPSAAAEQRETEGGVKGQIHHWMQWAQRNIAEHPKVALGVGVALGVTLGWLIKRR